ncbi:MAG: branched-chain amino acid transport system ATP-binding protein, partial [Clostridia bacterium]|nr:branched-chain amino acid transport system ATP-binding protein [Clostridia bacterium]
PNGAGKTTVFNLLSGIYKPTSGKIFFEGRDVTQYKTFQFAQLGISRTFQNIRLFSNLSVLQNVLIASNRQADYNFVAAMLRLPRYKRQEMELRDKTMELLRKVNLDMRAKEIARNLPYGHQRRLEIVRALATNPKLLLLDEPAAGMNPQESLELVEFIRWIKQKFNLTILLIEHHMDVIMEISDYIVVLNFGKTIARGNKDEIQENPEVIQAYLGTQEENNA